MADTNSIQAPPPPPIMIPINDRHILPPHDPHTSLLHHVMALGYGSKARYLIYTLCYIYTVFRFPTCAIVSLLTVAPIAGLVYASKHASMTQHVVETQIMVRLFTIGSSAGLACIMVANILGAAILARMTMYSLIKDLAHAYEVAVSEDRPPVVDLKLLLDTYAFNIHMFIILVYYCVISMSFILLTYWALNHTKKYRPNGTTPVAYLFYAATMAVAPMTIINFLTNLILCFSRVHVSLWYIMGLSIESILLTAPVTCLCCMLVGIQVIRREVMHESVPWWRAIALAVAMYGTVRVGDPLIIIHTLESSDLTHTILSCTWHAIWLCVLAFVVRQQWKKYVDIAPAEEYAPPTGYQMVPTADTPV